jgi:NNP family nitrate/nitrite transporter-like MFS transporter
VGGGNFASSMTNINSFYPQRLKGRALGLNAGGGNLGVAVVQLVGLAVLATAGKGHPRTLLGIYIPLVVVAALGAALFMDNIAHVRNEKRALRAACRDPHTWVISLLYIGTFGSFIGFSFAFGQVLQIQFAAHFLTSGKVDPVKIAYLTFLASVVLAASLEKSLGLFFAGFILLFVLSGLGNGSTYKMIPAIFRSKAELKIASGADLAAAEHDSRRLANAVIGIAGAVGAFGGVLVNVAFRQSFLTYKTGDAAYIGFIAFYVICLAATWLVYLRSPGSGRRLAGV